MWRLVPLLLLWVACTAPPKSTPPSSVIQINESDRLAKEMFVQSLFWEWKGSDTLAGLFLTQAAMLDTSSEFLSQKTLEFQSKISDSASFYWAKETLKRSNFKNVKALMGLGELYKKQGQLDSAIFYLESARSLNPRMSLSAIQDLAILYQIKQNYTQSLLVWADFAQKTNYPIQVVERYIQVAQKIPNDSLVLSFLAQAWTESEEPKVGQKYLEWLVTAQKFDTAHLLLNALMLKDSASISRYLVIKGMIYEEKNQLDSAYDIAKQINSPKTQELHHTALLALKLKKPSESLRWLHKIPQDSMLIENWALLSMVYRDLNQLDSALWAMKKVQQIRPTDPQIRREIWSLKSEIPKYRGVLTQELQDSLKQNPAQLDLREFKATLHFRWAQEDWIQGKSYQKEYAQAAQEYTSLILYQPQKSIYLYRYADVLAQLKEDAKAHQILERVYRMDTNSAVAQNAYGFFLLHHNQVDLGFRLIEKAWSQEPQNLAVTDSYAWAYYQKGNYSKALEIQSSIIAKVDSSSIESWEYYYHLGAIQWALKDSAAQKSVEFAHKKHPYRPEVLKLLKQMKGIK